MLEASSGILLRAHRNAVLLCSTDTQTSTTGGNPVQRSWGHMGRCCPSTPLPKEVGRVDLKNHRHKKNDAKEGLVSRIKADRLNGNWPYFMVTWSKSLAPLGHVFSAVDGGGHARTRPQSGMGLNMITEVQGLAGAQNRSSPQNTCITIDADESTSLFQPHDTSVSLQSLSFRSPVLTSTECGPLLGTPLGAGDTEMGQTLQRFSGSQTLAGVTDAMNQTEQCT